jgi:hypothetical protein
MDNLTLCFECSTGNSIVAEETSIAVTIGTSLAEGALSDGASFGLGQVLSLMGVDVSGLGEVNAKLDEIIDRLKKLQASIDQLSNYLKNALSQLSYDLAIQPLDPLIAANDTLKQRFKDLLALTDQKQIDQTKKLITDIIHNDLLEALATWNNCLMGGANQTSVIKAWGTAVYTHYYPVFGPDAAKAIQAQWDFIDAQQALSIMYLVEYYNEQGMPESAYNTINQWQQNRKAQLALLCAAVNVSDQVYTLTKGSDGKYSQTWDTFALRALPPGIIKVGDWLWSQDIVLQLPMLWWLFPNDNWATGFPFPPDGSTGWYVPTLSLLEDFLSKINAQIGQSRDHFAGAVNAAGFKSGSGTLVRSLWFWEHFPNPRRVRVGGDGSVTIDYSQPEWVYTAGYFIEDDSWNRINSNRYEPVDLICYNPKSADLIPRIFGSLLS